MIKFYRSRITKFKEEKLILTKIEQLSFTLVPWLEAGSAGSEYLEDWNKVIFLQIFVLY